MQSAHDRSILNPFYATSVVVFPCVLILARIVYPELSKHIPQ
jgi:hypothetical protein